MLDVQIFTSVSKLVPVLALHLNLHLAAFSLFCLKLDTMKCSIGVKIAIVLVDQHLANILSTCQLTKDLDMV